MKRVFSVFMFILLLIGLSALAFNIQPVKASGTIYIRADGSIDPPTATISTVDNVTYTFADNINDSIVIERDNIVVDGAFHIVEGTGSGDGITLSGRTNVTIKNTNIKNYWYGIYLNSSLGNDISGNNITENNGWGIYSEYSYSSDHNSISGNSVTNNGHGISLTRSSGNSISGNNITANEMYGIMLAYLSNYNTISGNNITANTGYGIVHGYSSGNTISGNNITANESSGIGLDYSSNNSISGNNITANTGGGIALQHSTQGNSVSGNNVANNAGGISLYNSSGNSVSGNNITENNGYGIWLGSSSNNSIFHNNFFNNAQQVISSSLNVWDDGYPSGGNYWSDYNGTDSNQDGIGDTAYVIDANNIDNYPLMVQYVIPEFPTFLILPLFIVATLLAVTIYRRKQRSAARAFSESSPKPGPKIRGVLT
jgi:parallel beta-helix repeat protein